MHPLPTAKDMEKLAIDAGVSMRQACVQAGVDPGVFRRWKRGAGSPTLANVEKLRLTLERRIARNGAGEAGP